MSIMMKGIKVNSIEDPWKIIEVKTWQIEILMKTMLNNVKR